MGVFSDKTGMERILFAVFTCENFTPGIHTPFILPDTHILAGPPGGNRVVSVI